MTKKEYVFKVLDKVKGYWNKEPIIRDYLVSNDDQDYVDYLYNKFTQAVNSTLQKQGQTKMLSLLEFLDDVKAKESVSRQADEEDLKNLDQILNNL